MAATDEADEPTRDSMRGRGARTKKTATTRENLSTLYFHCSQKCSRVVSGLLG